MSACRQVGQRRQAFTLVEIMIVVSIIALLTLMVVPGFHKARTSTQIKTCIANLHQLNNAKQQWAFEFRKGLNEVPTVGEIAPYLQAGRMPACAALGNYALRRVSRTPTCTRYQSGHTLNNLNMDEDAYPD